MFKTMQSGKRKRLLATKKTQPVKAAEQISHSFDFQPPSDPELTRQREEVMTRLRLQLSEQNKNRQEDKWDYGDRPTKYPNVYWRNNQVFYNPELGETLHNTDLYFEFVDFPVLSYALHIGTPKCICFLPTILVISPTETTDGESTKCSPNAIIIQFVAFTGYATTDEWHASVIVISVKNEWYYLFNPWGSDLSAENEINTTTLIMYEKLDDYIKQTYGKNIYRRNEVCPKWQGGDNLCYLWTLFWMYKFITTGTIPKLDTAQERSYVLRVQELLKWYNNLLQYIKTVIDADTKFNRKGVLYHQFYKAWFGPFDLQYRGNDPSRLEMRQAYLKEIWAEKIKQQTKEMEERNCSMPS